MFGKRMLLTLATLLALHVTANRVQAVDGCYYQGCPWGYWGFGPTAVYAPERLPYFTLYPPVYYSSVEPRTFGQSPFAFLPSAPVVGGAYRAEAADRPVDRPHSPRPLRIVNPYYTAADVGPRPDPPAPGRP